jgi:hypothetical protein
VAERACGYTVLGSSMDELSAIILVALAFGSALANISIAARLSYVIPTPDVGGSYANLLALLSI